MPASRRGYGIASGARSFPIAAHRGPLDTRPRKESSGILSSTQLLAPEMEGERDLYRLASLAVKSFDAVRDAWSFLPYHGPRTRQSPMRNTTLRFQDAHSNLDIFDLIMLENCPWNLRPARYSIPHHGLPFAVYFSRSLARLSLLTGHPIRQIRRGPRRHTAMLGVVSDGS